MTPEERRAVVIATGYADYGCYACAGQVLEHLLRLLPQEPWQETLDVINQAGTELTEVGSREFQWELPRCVNVKEDGV